jgi:hypothetical protein
VSLQSSSRTCKEVISNLSAAEAISLPTSLEPQTFHFKEDGSRRRHLGFVAEDMSEDIATPEKEGFNTTAVK